MKNNENIFLISIFQLGKKKNQKHCIWSNPSQPFKKTNEIFPLIVMCNRQLYHFAYKIVFNVARMFSDQEKQKSIISMHRVNLQSPETQLPYSIVNLEP